MKKGKKKREIPQCYSYDLAQYAKAAQSNVNLYFEEEHNDLTQSFAEKRRTFSKKL